MIFRTAATTAALAVVLAILGVVAGPQWDPQPLAEHLRPATENTVIGGGVDASATGTYPVETTTITIELDGTTVDGVIRRPEGAGDDLPGLVFLHGAGTGASATAFVDIATELASAGIVTLVPDKRLDNYSMRQRDYVRSAGDYARSVARLRETEGVDPARVGLYSESEGTWIAPVMAAEDPSIAFVVLVSAPVVRPREQAAFAVDAYLRNTDVPQGVFRAIPRAVGMKLPGGGFEYVDFDARPYLERLTQPVLVVYGTADASMPIEQGAADVIEAAAGNGNAAVTVRYYGGANHGIKVASGGGQSHKVTAGDALAPGFVRDLAAWIGSLPSSAMASPQIAGAQPNQRFIASSVPAPRWLGDGDLLLALVVGAVALVLLGPLVLLVARLRHRGGDRGRPDLRSGFRVPLAVLGGGAVATLVALVLYLAAVAQLALNYSKDAWIVQGGWVGVRLLGLVALVGAALILNRLNEVRVVRRAAGTPGRPGDIIAVGAAAKATLWAVCVGSGMLLATLAYWGVYQLGI